MINDDKIFIIMNCQILKDNRRTLRESDYRPRGVKIWIIKP